MSGRVINADPLKEKKGRVTAELQEKPPRGKQFFNLAPVKDRSSDELFRRAHSRNDLLPPLSAVVSGHEGRVLLGGCRKPPFSYWLYLSWMSNQGGKLGDNVIFSGRGFLRSAGRDSYELFSWIMSITGLLPLSEWQCKQAVTKLSNELSPPFDTGWIWSRVAENLVSCFWQ